MKNNINLINQLLRNLQEKKELTYLIATKDKHTALISVKAGQISYLRHGSHIGINALPLLQNMEVESFSERKHSLEHVKGKRVLPSTQNILEKLSVNLPKSWKEHQSSVKAITTKNQVNTIASNVQDSTIAAPPNTLKNRDSHLLSKDVKLVVPIEPKYTEILDSMIQIVRTALQQTLGPISEFIYEDAAAVIPQLKNRDNLANLINIVVEEIDEDEYQLQFLKIVKEQLIGIVKSPR